MTNWASINAHRLRAVQQRYPGCDEQHQPRQQRPPRPDPVDQEADRQAQHDPGAAPNRSQQAGRVVGIAQTDQVEIEQQVGNAGRKPKQHAMQQNAPDRRRDLRQRSAYP